MSGSSKRSLGSHFVTIWLVASVIVGGVALLNDLIFHAPFVESNSTTLVFTDTAPQRDVAKALATVLGEPVVALNTDDVKRYLMRDDTSLDAASLSAQAKMPYRVVALKQIVLPLWRFWELPTDDAKLIANSLRRSGYNAQIWAQPDKAFPVGSVVIITSNVFAPKGGAGAAILVRRAAFLIGGPMPSNFHGW